MTDPLRRALRTFIQAIIGSFLAANVLSLIATNGVLDYSQLKKAGVSAIAAGFIALLTFVMNLLEDKTTFPALLKAPASEGENPVPDPEPESETGPELDEPKTIRGVRRIPQKSSSRSSKKSGGGATKAK